jgi:hypothetical protein
MNPRRIPKRIAGVIAGTTGLTVGAVGGAVGITGNDDSRERPIPSAEREQAEEAALGATGGGTVTGTEVGDEESLYEVEVTLDDGTQVDVQLDEDFDVVGTEDEADGVKPDD